MSSLFGGQGYGSPTGLNPTSTTTGTMKERIPSGYRKGAIQQFTPQQMQLFQQLFGQVGPESYLSRLSGGDEAMFEQIERPALQQFAGIQGNIASRYSGAGLGARRSSAFQNEMTSAGQQFASQLQSQRQALQRQALSDLLGFSGALLGQRPYEQQLIKKQEKPWGSFVGKLLGGIPGAIAGYAGEGWKGAAKGFAGGFESMQGLGGLG